MFEFIELFGVYLAKNANNQRENDNQEIILSIIPNSGKSFLHMAIEYGAYLIASYLLINMRCDPNSLSQKGIQDVMDGKESKLADMTILHIAIATNR